jgi:L-threonylcarbamoyladenylate synthase
MQIFNAASLTDRDFDQILSFLRAGGVIGFPTDTAYGLGADPWNEAAVRQIFKIKGRPETNPILLLVNSFEMLEQVAFIPKDVHELTEIFWPGPLTLILPAKERTVLSSVTAGTGTVGARWPAAPFALRLIDALQKPLTATSANRTGMGAAITAEEVRFQLHDRLDMLIDGGRLPARSGSTLLDLSVDPPVLLREGPVSLEALQEALKGRISSKTLK